VQDNFRYELSPNLKIIETHRESQERIQCVRSLMKFGTFAGECSSQLETAAHRNKLRVFLLFNLCCLTLFDASCNEDFN